MDDVLAYPDVRAVPAAAMLLWSARAPDSLCGAVLSEARPLAW